jgi:enoyl-CoA hydratase/carnithine racemase
MSDNPAAVLHDKRGPVLWITINRPDRRNAINAEVIAGIREGYRAAHADPEMRAIVLTGVGEKAFCAGDDLQPGKGFAFDLPKPNIDYAGLIREAQNATLPTIARINGVCMAGGMGLLCMTARGGRRSRAARPHRRQVADRDPPRQVRDASNRVDVLRPGACLHRGARSRCWR